VPFITATAQHDLTCADCGQRTLTVVTVSVLLPDGPLTAGGWAHCRLCDATPHPGIEVPGRPEPPTDPTGFVTLTGRHDLTCGGCDQPALSVVTVSVLLPEGSRDAGGFAHCRACDATPHPTMEVPSGR
jgi:hypothetical protein